MNTSWVSDYNKPQSANHNYSRQNFDIIITFFFAFFSEKNKIWLDLLDRRFTWNVKSYFLWKKKTTKKQKKKTIKTVADDIFIFVCIF